MARISYLLAICILLCSFNNCFADSSTSEENLSPVRDTRAGSNQIIDPSDPTWNGSIAWPGNTIPYMFPPGFDEDRKAQAILAMNDIMTAVPNCWVFREKTNDDTYWVKFSMCQEVCTSDQGNLAVFGGSYQTIYVGGGWCQHGALVHELLHTIGFSHEQSRDDRDDYIRMNWENIPENLKSIYLKDGEADSNGRHYNSSYYGIPYNFKSIMHYATEYYGYNGSIWTNKRNKKAWGWDMKDDDVGQMWYLSKGDLLMIARKGNCPDPKIKQYNITGANVGDKNIYGDTKPKKFAAKKSAKLSEGAQSDKQKSNDLFNSVQNREFFQENIDHLATFVADADPNLFENCLDHFDGSCSETFYQRFWAWDGYYSPGNPIFVFLGAEGDASDSIDNDWTWITKYGRHFGAYCAVLEHRFYGTSLPADPYSKRQFLTSQQAIADFAFFVKSLQQANSTLATGPVVVFGGSYGGNLATWVRTIHPELVHAAVASSAPLESRYEYPQYIQTISEVIRDSQPDHTCYNNIKSVFQCMENLISGKGCSQTKVEASWIPYELNTDCFRVDFADNYTTQSFFRSQAYKWSNNNEAIESNTLCPLLNKEFKKNSDDIIKTYSRFLLKANSTGVLKLYGPKCPAEKTDMYKYTFAPPARGKWDSWGWQSCNEVGNSQIADPVHKLFGYSFFDAVDIGVCQANYPDDNFSREKIQKNVAKTNTYYKGKTLVERCIIFVQGTWDPWHHEGITKESELKSKDNYLVWIENGQHCFDTYYPPYKGFKDTENIAKAQKSIQHKLGKLLEKSC